VTVPDTFAPSEGETKEIEGDVLSTVFRTVTEMVFTLLLPAPSKAVALNVCVPSGTADVFQLKV
jgi:hypothetical protein